MNAFLASLRTWLAARAGPLPWDGLSIGAFLTYYGTMLSPEDQQKVVEALVALTGVSADKSPAVVGVLVFVLRSVAWARSSK